LWRVATVEDLGKSPTSNDTGDLFSKQPATKWFSFTRLTLGCGLTSGFPYFPLVSLLVNNLMPIY
jgi:hypothetical protein